MADSKDFIWVVTGRFFTAVVGIASLRFSTALLPPDQFGFLTILIAFQSFSSLFLINPVGQYFNRNTHAWADEGSVIPRLKSFYVWVLWAALLGATISFGWSLSQPLSWVECIVVGTAVMFMVVVASVNAHTLYLLNMLGQRSQAAVWAALTSSLGLGFSLVLTYHFGDGRSWFLGQALGMAVGALGAAKALRQLLPASSEVHKPLLEPGDLRTFIFPLTVATGFMWWLFSGYRLLLEAHWGLAALGSAFVGISLMSQLWGLFETLAMQFIYPMFFRRIAVKGSPESESAFSDLLNILGPVYLVMMAATVFAAPDLLKIFVDESYANVVPFVMVGAVIECCRALSNVLGTAAQVDQKMVALITPYSFGAVLLTAGLLFNNSNGEIFDAILILAGAVFFTFVTMAIIMRRVQRLNVDWIRWCVAFAIILCAIFLLKINFIVSSDLSSAVISVMLTGALALIATMALLWKNPRCERLLAVRLNSK